MTGKLKLGKFFIPIIVAVVAWLIPGIPTLIGQVRDIQFFLQDDHIYAYQFPSAFNLAIIFGSAVVITTQLVPLLVYRFTKKTWQSILAGCGMFGLVYSCLVVIALTASIQHQGDQVSYFLIMGAILLPSVGITFALEVITLHQLVKRANAEFDRLYVNWFCLVVLSVIAIVLSTVGGAEVVKKNLYTTRDEKTTEARLKIANICGDNICTLREQKSDSPYYCPSECNQCGDGFCSIDEHTKTSEAFCPKDCAGFLDDN